VSDGLVIASNRGPVRWEIDADGRRHARKGAGGLVTALTGALAQEPGQWVSVALDTNDREIAAEHHGKALSVDLEGTTTQVRPIDVGERFEGYYDEVSNRWLWFTVHDLWGAPYEPSGVGWHDPWYEAYLPANAQVGQAAAEALDDLGGNADVMLQDYHLCAAGRHVRRAHPKARLLHYLHTPWPTPRMLGRLPDPVVSGVLDGLLANDVVAFSSPRWAERFRETAQVAAGAARDGDALLVDGRRVVVADFVLGVDTDALTRRADADDVRAAGATLDEQRGDRAMLVRADRTDLSKNILRGLLAYERLLETHPEWRERVWHYANLNASRQGVPEYRAYLQACQQVAERIVERFGEAVLEFSVGDDYPAALAALQRYDVLLTNPVIDGTNLVAKEGAVLNERDGVLVLSRNAGACDVLGDAAVTVNPYDVESTAEALHTALSLQPDERAARAHQLRRQAQVGPPGEWLAAQRAVLRDAVAERPA
jgi:trehalose 6-phosphate synthase